MIVSARSASSLRDTMAALVDVRTSPRMLRQLMAHVAIILLHQCGELTMVAAQLPMPYNSTDCDVRTLAARVTSINAACCIPGDEQTCDEHPCGVGCVWQHFGQAS